jgi:N-acetylneuraminate synthase
MNEKVTIIAEAGVNHNGDVQKALQLIDEAAFAGADYVKFQSFKAESLVNKTAQKADYQKKNMQGEGDTQFEMLKKLEFQDDWYPLLMQRCKDKNIKFLSTGFDLDSLELLKDKIDFYKIPSGEITNLPYLEKVAQLGLPIVMSTGMADLKEVKDALEILIQSGANKNEITILHCNTEYPTPMQDVNLLAMNHIKDELGVAVGYSDHTLGIEVPIAAVALGAKVIEKHFTLDRTMDGPDHAASLEPDELKAMVKAIRNIEVVISGSGIKVPSPSELKNKDIARKSIVASKLIKKGDLLTEENLTTKRPGSGVSPMQWEQVLGQKAKRDFKPDELITLQ